VVLLDKESDTSSSDFLLATYLFRDNDNEVFNLTSPTHTNSHVIRPHLFATSYAVSLVYCMPFCEEHVTDTRRDARQMPVFTRACHKYPNVMVLRVPRCAPRHDGWLSAFLLEPKTYYMHHQFNIQKLLCSAHSAFMCFAWISKKKQRLFLYTALTYRFI
jgi:hypothetical protein